jgi:hypothetical protein
MTARKPPRMTVEEFDAELHRALALAPLEMCEALVPLMEAARGALSERRARAMREAVAGGVSKAELARRLGVSLVQVSKAIGEPSGEGRRGRPRKGPEVS